MAAASARQSQRVPIDAPVRLTLRAAEASRSLPARALDLSEGGMRLALDTSLAVGEEVTCNLQLNDERASLQGRVRWSKPVAAAMRLGRMGLGIQWDPLSDEQNSLLRRWLATNSEHRELVLLHVPNLQEPLRARGCVTRDTLQLVAVFPQLSPGAEVEFQLGETGSRRIGRIQRVDLQRSSENGALELALELKPAGSSRARRHVMYAMSETEQPTIQLLALPDPSHPPALVRRLPEQRRSRVTTQPLPGGSEREQRRARADTLRVPTLNSARINRAATWAVASASIAVLLWALRDTTRPIATPAWTLAAKAAPKKHAAESERRAPASRATDPVVAPVVRAQADSPPVQPRPAPAARAQSFANSAPNSPAASVQALGSRSEIFVPVEGSLDGMRSTLWRDPSALVIDLPQARVAANNLLRGLRGGGVRRVRVDDTRPAPQLQIFLSTIVSRYAAKAVPHGVLVTLEHDLRPMP